MTTALSSHAIAPWMPSLSTDDSAVPSSGGTLVCSAGRALPLRSAILAGRCCGGMGRIVLEQTFENPHAEPLHVTYQLPLPHDGAVSGFSFRIGDREIVGEVDRKQAARERFESALAQGRTAAHLEQERASLFTQEVGNIPPGATLVARIEVDQPLSWIADAGQRSGGWEWRFPTVVAPRYLAEAGRVPDADRVAVTVADRPRPIAMALELTIADAVVSGGTPASPSHALTVERGGRVAFADESVGLDRDVVVRWPVATPQVALGVDTGYSKPRGGASGELFGLLTLVPPTGHREAPVARDLVVLLDTSGSMSGEPLAQAQRVATALIDGLRPDDTLELIEFSNQPRRFSAAARPADRATKDLARQWIASLRASGGTEMVSGILAALRGVRAEAQRQVIVITDGLIGFEQDVLAAILGQLPAGSRLHTVGVGSAVNRSLTGPAARAGRGVEVVIGLGEDPERASARLLSRTEDPLVVDVEIEGSAIAECSPQRLPDLYAGAPALVPVRLHGSGGEVRLRGRTASGTWEARAMVRTPADGIGNPGVAALFGREKVEDLELSRAAGGDAAAIDAEIERVGLALSIATRLTSWLAVSERIDVDPGEPSRREEIPQEVPYGMSIEGLGLRGTAAMPVQWSMVGGAAAPRGRAGSGAASESERPKRKGGGFAARVRSVLAKPTARRAAPPAPAAPAKASKEESVHDSFDRADGGPNRTESDDFAAVSSMDEEREATPAFSGTVTRQSDETWFIEVVLPDGWQWPEGTATLTLADGTVVTGVLTSTEKRPPRPDGVVVFALVFVAERIVAGPAVSLSLTIDSQTVTVVLATP